MKKMNSAVIALIVCGLASPGVHAQSKKSEKQNKRIAKNGAGCKTPNVPRRNRHGAGHEWLDKKNKDRAEQLAKRRMNPNETAANISSVRQINTNDLGKTRVGKRELPKIKYQLPQMERYSLDERKTTVKKAVGQPGVNNPQKVAKSNPSGSTSTVKRHEEFFVLGGKKYQKVNGSLVPVDRIPAGATRMN